MDLRRRHAQGGASALALRQAYRLDAALLLQACPSPPPPPPVGSRCGPATGRKRPRGNSDAKEEEEEEAPFAPPSNTTTTNSNKNINGASAALPWSAVGTDLSAAGRGLVLRSDREAGEDARHLHPEYHCAPCGRLFFPPPAPAHGMEATAAAAEGSTVVRIRSLARGRTRRRRAARVRARHAALDVLQRKDRGGGRRWGTLASTAVGQGPTAGHATGHGHAAAAHAQANSERRRTHAALHAVRDGTAYHCAVYACGHCGQRTRLGGIDVAAREPVSYTHLRAHET